MRERGDWRRAAVRPDLSCAIDSHIGPHVFTIRAAQTKKARGLAPPGPLVRVGSFGQLMATATRPWAKEAPVERQQQQVAVENIVGRL
jgi:hypothetical protein